MCWPAGTQPQQLPGGQEQTPVEQVQAYFTTCDRDGNGWVSYPEARESLGLDREDFAGFETVRDGRTTLEEFRVRFGVIEERVGLLPRPKQVRSSSVDLPRDPLQILTAYDRNNDGAIDEGEIATLLYDYGRAEIPASLALQKLDENTDGGLRDAELELLSRLIATLHAAGPDALPSQAPPRSVSELFGQARPRPGDMDRAPEPPQIVGPVPAFRRLDLDDVGGIEVADLRGLLSPLQLVMA